MKYFFYIFFLFFYFSLVLHPWNPLLILWNNFRFVKFDANPFHETDEGGLMNERTHPWIKQISMDNAILSMDDKSPRMGYNILDKISRIWVRQAHMLDKKLGKRE